MGWIAAITGTLPLSSRGLALKVLSAQIASNVTS
uniref:Uncharacterized protein n=1 Tax=Arundo donax TaxID=35708 RepID=A0A0A9BLR1_ARUDO